MGRFDVAKMEAHIVVADKELVDWLLSMNTHNRAVKKSQVETLKREIENGDFMLTNQGIGISVDGVLNDGQHRLMAIAAMGYPPVQLLIVTGLEAKAQAVVDRSAKRSQTDVIRLVLNRTVSNQAVAIANVMMTIGESDDGFTSKRIGRTSDFAVADYLLEHIDVFTAVIGSVGASARASMVAALMHFAMRHSVEMACSLGAQIKTGENLGQRDPAYRLRQYLASHKAGGGAAQLEAYGFTVSACCAYARGEQIGLLKASKSWSGLPKNMAKLRAA